VDIRHSKATLISLGAVDTTGTPLSNQIARFFDADTVHGSPNLTFSGSVLALNGNMTISSFLAFGGAAAGLGEIRLSNTSSIYWRNFADDGDIEVFSFGASDVFDLGSGGGILEFNVNAPVTTFINGRIEVNVASGNALRVGPSGGDTVFNVDANSRIVEVNETLRVSNAVTVSAESTNIQFASVLVGTPSGTTATATLLIPAGAVVLGVTTRVTSLITGPAGYDVGDGTNTDRWGNSIAVANGTTSDPTDYVSSAMEIFPVATDVVITSDGVAFTGGQVRVTVHYMTLTAPVG